MFRIYKYIKLNGNHDKFLSKITLLFLGFCVLGIISHNKGFIDEFGQTPFIMFIVSEIFYIWYIMNISLRSKSLRILFTILFVTLLLTLPFLVSKTYNETLFDPFFAVESLLASSVSFAYFLQLGDEIKYKNVLEDKITLINLGLFFCYSLPFAYNTTVAAINILEPELFDHVKSNIVDRFLLITISRVGTLCYIVLNIFLLKAFKWKTPVQIGI